MKKLFTLFAIAALVCVGCSDDYDDSGLQYRVGSLESRVAKLEELCKQMNTNISALQTIVTALQNNDYVTGVAPVTSNGETIGYTITFTKSAPITIYHGQNGKDGHTPVIGVRQDTDGIYYWTLDGDWLLDGSGSKIKAEGRDGQNGTDGKDGADGQPGKDGQDGAPGKDGQDGAPGADGKDGENGKDGVDGKDGITPQLKIEGGYWFVSTDNGATWTNLGKATGEDGKDGEDAVCEGSFFRDVDVSADEYVRLTLADGTILTLPKYRALTISFAEGDELFFDVDQTITVNYTIGGGNDKNIVKAEMQNLDNNYTLRTTQTTAAKGTIAITAKVPSENRVIVSISDGKQTVMAAIAVSIKPGFDGKIVKVETPGTLAKLIADYDKTTITELTVIGNLNDSDIRTLNSLPNLAVLDMENVNLEELPSSAFYNKTSLTDVKLPKTLKLIKSSAFGECSGLTSVTIGNSVTEIRNYAFTSCSSLTSVTIPDSVTSIGICAFDDCSGLTSIYCKAQTPPAIEEGDIFFSWNQLTLYVPTGCKDAYAAAEYWKNAKEIIEMEF